MECLKLAQWLQHSVRLSVHRAYWSAGIAAAILGHSSRRRRWRPTSRCSGRTQPREWAAEAAEAGRATSASVMRAEAMADTLSMLEEDGKAVYIVFIAELAGDGDKAPAQALTRSRRTR